MAKFGFSLDGGRIMFKFTYRELLSLTLIAWGTVGSAQAQMATATESGGVTINGSRTSAQAVSPAAVVLGWNTIHPANCVLTKPGVDWVLKLTSIASEGSVYITSVYPEKHMLMTAQCATGNKISFFVISKSGSTFTWTSLQSWPSK